jgi:hypothetical protein
MKIFFSVSAIIFLLITGSILAKDIATLRDGVDVSEQAKTKPIPKPITTPCSLRSFPTISETTKLI